MKLKSLFMAMLLGSFCSFALAANMPSVCFPRGNNEAQCNFNNLKYWNKNVNNPNYQDAEFFYCIPATNDQPAHMENHSILIGGFDSNGLLNASAETLNKYEFAAFIDPNKNNGTGIVYVTNVAGCFYGKGPGRTIMPGQPQQGH